jgi:hypothetical protein
MGGSTSSIDKCDVEPGVHAVFDADLFLGLDFGSELTDLHKGPWEHTPPGRLKPRRGPIPLRGALSYGRYLLALQFRSETKLQGLFKS